MPGSGNFQWFYEPVFNLFGRQISPAGIAAFVGCVVAGLFFSSFLQSGFMRRQLSRLGLDKGFVAILTASFSLVAFLGFVVLGLNLGGLPIPWEAKVPAIGPSSSQIFQLIALVAIVFWFASAAKRFLFNRFLSKSGLDRALQYTIAQICGYLVLTVGILVALQSAGLNLSALAVFAGAVGVGIGFGLQNITRNMFTVELPAIMVSHMRTSSESSPVAPLQPSQIRLLVVEDHRDTTRMLYQVCSEGEPPAERHVAAAVSRVPRQRGHAMTYAAHAARQRGHATTRLTVPLSRLIHGSGGTRPPTPNGADIRGPPSPKPNPVLKANQSLQSYPLRAYARRPSGKRRGSAFAQSVIEAGHVRLERARAFLHASRSARGRLCAHNLKHTTDFRTEIVAEEDDFRPSE